MKRRFLPPAAQGNRDHVARDTKVDRLLLAQDFTYWGNTGPQIPAHLLGLFPNPRGQKCLEAGSLLTDLHQLVGLDKPLGVVGDPADWDNVRYFPPS